MKKILITGKNSYIGETFENWLSQTSETYEITTLDMRDPNWRTHDFSVYDVVFHVAGIAHADVGKVSEAGKQLYYQVNTDLTIQTAEKFKADTAQTDQVHQFIFMSSIIVYGEQTSVNRKRVITKDTPPAPSSFYGDSKLQAEIGLNALADERFRIAILRPPMIYGPNSKGNYPMLAKLATRLPAFPNVKNERSMLFVDNLMAFLQMLVEEKKAGLFFPQNAEYVRTSHMVQKIAQAHRRRVYLFSWLNWGVRLLGLFPGKIGGLTNKAFGNLVYEKVDYGVDLIDFDTSIRLTEEEMYE